jgi:transcription elongation factor Elf1
MNCWHCNSELVLNFTTEQYEKFYQCSVCEKWYEMYKEKVKINGAVPVRFIELDARPQIPAPANRLSA